MALVHCIYCSAASSPDFGLTELEALLQTCRRRNAALGVSGMLLFHSGSFFQVLEGEHDVVETLFAKIATDPRHGKVVKIILEPIAQRDFSEWTMGLAQLGEAELNRMPGLNDFFTQGDNWAGPTQGEAKALLTAFRKGLWRMAPPAA